MIYKPRTYSKLDTYFAAARGYQGENGDVKALAMKKWFNTNYHYMVTEIDDNTEIRLADDKPFTLYQEAQTAGVKTKPVIIGAYTFLKLARYTGKKTAADFVSDTVKAYTEILKKFNKIGAEWIQVDEPCLVMDMTADDTDIFEQLYTEILKSKGSVKILLQTYFGDVRDCYQNICKLDFDGVGLDFIEGKQSEKLIEANGFPKDKILFAGLVNGKTSGKTITAQHCPHCRNCKNTAMKSYLIYRARFCTFRTQRGMKESLVRIFFRTLHLQRKSLQSLLS